MKCVDDKMEKIKILMNGNDETSGVVALDLMVPYDGTVLVEKICKMIAEESSSKKTEESLKVTISERLMEIGIPVRLKGYRYMITAIEKVVEDETLLEGVTKILYPDVAKIHNSTPQRVEKAIRHAIEVAWENEVKNDIKKEFNYSGKARPTNSEFIASVSRFIKLSA